MIRRIPDGLSRDGCIGEEAAQNGGERTIAAAAARLGVDARSAIAGDPRTLRDQSGNGRAAGDGRMGQRRRVAVGAGALGYRPRARADDRLIRLATSSAERVLRKDPGAKWGVFAAKLAPIAIKDRPHIASASETALHGMRLGRRPLRECRRVILATGVEDCAEGSLPDNSQQSSRCRILGLEIRILPTDGHFNELPELVNLSLN